MEIEPYSDDKIQEKDSNCAAPWLYIFYRMKFLKIEYILAVVHFSYNLSYHKKKWKEITVQDTFLLQMVLEANT